MAVLIAARRTPPLRTSAPLRLLVASLLPALVACAPEPQHGGESLTRSAAAAPVASPAPAAAVAPSFERLLGGWQRTEGGYVLEVRTVDEHGSADVAYRNPRSIHVDQAVAGRAGGTLTLFVELRDEGYPGSAYNLGYDAARDLLEGTYYQAVEGQTFAVTFTRR